MAKGIWVYIQKRGQTYWFWKRWAAPVVSQFGDFDRQSLNTRDEHQAEIRARDCLIIHDAKTEIASAGKTFHDFTKITSLRDIPRDVRPVLRRIIKTADLVRVIIDEIIYPVGKHKYKIKSQADLMEEFNVIKNRDSAATLYDKCLSNGLLFDRNSEVFKILYLIFRRDEFRNVANRERRRRILISRETSTSSIKKIEGVFTNPAQEPDKVLSRPAPKMSDFFAIYPAKFLSSYDAVKVRGMSTNIRWMISGIGDKPINYVKSMDIIDLFDRLQFFPAGHSKMKNNTRTFDQMCDLGESEDEKTITKKTAFEWWKIMYNFFQQAYIAYRDEFKITNPFEGLEMTKIVKGRDSIKKRAWYPEEVKTLFSYDECTDLDFKNQFAWTLVFQLFHGNRLSELTRRECSQVKQLNGVWYLDVPNGKTDQSVRMVPIHDFIIKLGFLDYVKYRQNLTGRDKKFIFDEDFARQLPINFNTFCKRKGIYDPTRTLHQLRSTWITASERIEMREAVSRYIVGHSGSDIHDSKYKSVWIDTTKKAMDQIVIDGFPYDNYWKGV